MTAYVGPSHAGVFVTPLTSARQLQRETFAQDFLLPSFTVPPDFPNGTPAIIAPDAINPGIIEAQFAVFFAPIAVYWDVYVPVWAVSMRVQLISRAPLAAIGNVGVKLYQRAVMNGAPVGAWISTTFTDVAFAGTGNPQYDVRAPGTGETLTDWGMVPAVSSEGTFYQFIIERQPAPVVPPNLAADWFLFGVMQTFSG